MPYRLGRMRASQVAPPINRLNPPLVADIRIRLSKRVRWIAEMQQQRKPLFLESKFGSQSL